ncbi:hypothetical protein ABT75_13720 [Salmonella enterica subsp. enterica serovar Typhimurium]|nr:hypothetical protein ABT75_13720 [Salmonella enterica subsp. enterica serovar Typhimurium]
MKPDFAKKNATFQDRIIFRLSGWEAAMANYRNYNVAISYSAHPGKYSFAPVAAVEIEKGFFIPKRQ